MHARPQTIVNLIQIEILVCGELRVQCRAALKRNSRVRKVQSRLRVRSDLVATQPPHRIRL